MTTRSGRRARPTSALGQVADADAATRAHVVDLAGHAALGEQRVRAHDVAHVGEVADGIAVAERDLVGAVALGGGDARREAGHEERRGLAGSGVVERTGAHDREPVLAVRVERDAPRPRPCSSRTG